MSCLNLLDVPQVCLEEIMKTLKFSEISQLGGACRSLREVAKTLLRLHLKQQEDVFRRAMEKLEVKANESDRLTIEDHLCMALLHSVRTQGQVLQRTKCKISGCWKMQLKSTEMLTQLQLFWDNVNFRGILPGYKSFNIKLVELINKKVLLFSG